MGVTTVQWDLKPIPMMDPPRHHVPRGDLREMPRQHSTSNYLCGLALATYTPRRDERSHGNNKELVLVFQQCHATGHVYVSSVSMFNEHLITDGIPHLTHMHNSQGSTIPGPELGLGVECSLYEFDKNSNVNGDGLVSVSAPVVYALTDTTADVTTASSACRSDICQPCYFPIAPAAVWDVEGGLAHSLHPTQAAELNALALQFLRCRTNPPDIQPPVNFLEFDWWNVLTVDGILLESDDIKCIESQEELHTYVNISRIVPEDSQETQWEGELSGQGTPPEGIRSWDDSNIIVNVIRACSSHGGITLWELWKYLIMNIVCYDIDASSRRGRVVRYVPLQVSASLCDCISMCNILCFHRYYVIIYILVLHFLLLALLRVLLGYQRPIE